MTIAAPFLMKELGMNAAWMGVLLSAFFWPYSLAQVPAGWLIDKYGMGRVYAAGFFVWSLAVGLTGFMGAAVGLMAMRMLLGLGQGAPFPASVRAVVNWFGAGERGTVTGVYLSGNRLGQAAVVGIGPAIILTLGWRGFFWAAGAAGLLWLIPWLLTMKNWERGPGQEIAAAGKRQATMKESAKLLGNKTVLGVFLGFFAYDYVWFLYVTWMPGYLTLERHFGPREMAIASSVPLVVVSFITALAGFAGDVMVRRGWKEVDARRALITFGMIVGGLIVPAGFVEDGVTAAVLMGISICGLGITAPNCWALTQAVCPKRLAGTAGGIQNFGGNLGGVIAPALTGWIAHVTGSFQIAFAIAGLILVGGIIAYWSLIREGRMSDEDFGDDAAADVG